MLPTSLLKEIYDEHITQDEFERMMAIPQTVAPTSYIPCQPLPQYLTRALHMNAKPKATSNDTGSISSAASSRSLSPMSSRTTSRSASPTSPETEQPTSYWQDLEVYSAGITSSDSNTAASPTWVSFEDKRSSKNSRSRSKFCSFCFHNKKHISDYTSHDLKDSVKNVTCPILFGYVCKCCGATGTEAHTPKYCPRRKY